MHLRDQSLATNIAYYRNCYIMYTLNNTRNFENIMYLCDKIATLFYSIMLIC